MCRLLGFASHAARSVTSVIGGDQSQVFLDMTRLHRDGWGCAWVDSEKSPDVHSVKHANPGFEDTELNRALTSKRATSEIIHLRMATDGMSCQPSNTHPFAAEGVAFAHNGSIPDPVQLEPLLTPGIRESLLGETDSERYFALIRSHHEQGMSWLEAARTAARTIRDLFPHTSLNALMLTENELIAIHCSTNAPSPLAEFSKRGIAADQLPTDHADAYYQMHIRQLDDGTVVFASSGIDVSEWDALPSDSVTRVDLETLMLETLAL